MGKDTVRIKNKNITSVVGNIWAYIILYFDTFVNYFVSQQNLSKPF
jgi:hypothetical protein